MGSKTTKDYLKLIGNTEKIRYWKNRYKKTKSPENEGTKKEIIQLRKELFTIKKGNEKFYH